jgi:putative restriction endonuclease
MSMDSSIKIRLEKAASDNGFDLPSDEIENGWRLFKSTHSPLQIWLRHDEGKYMAAFSQEDLKNGLIGLAHLSPFTPDQAKFTMVVQKITELHPLLRRAYQLSRSLPREPLAEFERQTQTLPKTTEAERLVIQRVGQNIFRERLIEYWDGKCAISAAELTKVLKASHIKPWRDCETDEERLDVFNGLLLTPNYDALFDQGFITFDVAGKIAFSHELEPASASRLGVSSSDRIENIEDEHRKYLDWHRNHIFRR